jgi:RNA polymerase sigma factor (sigma-70 family)
MGRELVERAQRGDRDAFATLARQYGDALFVLAERILRDADLADEAMQQTLISAWRDLPRLRDPDRFEPWLRRILVRSCYQEVRRIKRWTARVLPLMNEPGSADDVAFTIDERDVIERGFRRLSPEHRAILAMHHYLGLQPADIAETLAIPLGTVRSRLHYAHRAMRAALAADDREPVRGRSSR